MDKMDLSETTKEANNIHDTPGIEALVKTFPERIIFLTELMKTPEFSFTDYDFKCVFNPNSLLIMDNDNSKNSEGITQENGKHLDSYSHDIIFEQGNIQSIKIIIDATNILKPHIKQLIEDANDLSIRLFLMIPKIEDGNNFGVDVQKSTLADINTIVENNNLFYGQMSTYYISRAKLLTKMIKYPTVEDYRRLLVEFDCKQYWSIVSNLQQIRNSYSLLRDIVIKNMDKIINPRT